ncbi:hypothetical protein LCGC14_0372800 [marine sediment metagenome]|uniref:Uncharacterized protein n=1 Tax=marine sediment metagenome TaxID=412755 RepID=A0A0F9TAN3_9ZZZZ
MTRKILYGALVVTLIALVSILPAQAFELSGDFDEPCLGGMGILAAICNVVNDIHDFTHDLETSIASLNATQILQQVQIDDLEGDVTVAQTNIGTLQGNVISINSLIADHHFEVAVTDLQTDVGILQDDLATVETAVAALPAFAFTIQTDTDSLPCEQSSAPVDGWCPNGLSLNSFKITDVAVSDSSFILAHVDGQIGASFGCFVTNVDAGSFTVSCVSIIADGAELYYVIIE